ncbi:MAG: hypothetical protein LBT48_03585 [Prevotellaceae bacterium]|jgi:hypothetical protein|nr:hypothetical protein [Prevotellaceae bacterium]
MNIPLFLQCISIAPPPPAADSTERIRQFAEQYPWCGIARQLLLEAYQLSDSHKTRSYTPVVAVYTINRRRLYQRLQQLKAATPLPAVVENTPAETPASTQPIAYPQPITTLPAPLPPLPETFTAAPSGDYFGMEEPENPGNDAVGRFITEKPRIRPVASALPCTNDLMPSVKPCNNYTFIDMVTETLAKIYTEQGFYSQAIDVYKKLSLQKPKKSIYFASLIKDLKLKSKF